MRSKSRLVVSVSREDAKGQRLGDLVAGITKSLGLKKCPGCKGRQKSLNRFKLDRFL